jgi:formylglycine-generating enzyme required for sulfatase activity
MTEVTQGQWRAVMGDNPSHFQNGKNYPVESVSWNDVQAFLEKLNTMDPGKNYRLPTEAEWEYACRAGTTGEQYGELDDIAWYWKNSEDQTHPVAKMQSNAWGMYDMLGNVWEWCADYLFGYYYFGSFTRSANRGWDYPDRRHVNYGFRCARD